MVRRGINPGIGKLALPGGYVDEMETFENAARRELFEETGLDLCTSNKIEKVESQIAQNNRLLIFVTY